MANAEAIKRDGSRDSVAGMRLPGHGLTWKELLIALKDEWNKDRVSDVAGMVTFRGILSLFPFILFLVTLGGLLIDAEDEARLIDQLSHIAPGAVTQILGDRVRSLAQNSSTGLLTVSILIAIWTASGGMSALMRALNTTYGVTETRKWWKARGIALAMTLFAAALALVAAL